MFCPNCNNEVADGTLVCNTCGAPVARIEQEHKVAAAKDAVGNSVKKWFLSPLFIVIASIVSVIALLDVIAVFSSFADGIFAILYNLVFSLIPAIFAIIATVGVWKVVASRNKPIDAGNINKVAKYLGVMRAFQIVYVVFTAILGAFLTVISALLWLAADAIGDFADEIFELADVQLEGGVIGAAGAVLFFGVVIGVTALMIMRANYAAAYGNARNHVKVLSSAVESGANVDTKALAVTPPYMRMFVLSALDLIINIVMFSGFFSFMLVFTNIALLVTLGVMFILIKKNSGAAIEELNKEVAALDEINAQMQPAYQQPMYQQPAYQQPMYQQPAYQQPAYQQPMYQQPAYQQPMYQQPQQPPQQ